MPVDVRDALHAVIDARRDIRRYRADPVPDDVLEHGRALGSGNTGGLLALGEIGIGNTTVAAALVALLLDLDADTVVGLGSGADSAILDRKRDVITRALAPQPPRDIPSRRRTRRSRRRRRARTRRSHRRDDRRRRQPNPVVLDGLAVSVAALTATLLEPAAQHCLIAGQRSREAAHPLVLEALGCEPLLDLRIRSGEGAGAALACGLLLNAPPCPPRNSTHHPYLTDDRPRVPQHAARARPDPAANYGEVATGGVGPVGARSRWVPFGLTQPARRAHRRAPAFSVPR